MCLPPMSLNLLVYIGLSACLSGLSLSAPVCLWWHVYLYIYLCPSVCLFTVISHRKNVLSLLTQHMDESLGSDYCCSGLLFWSGRQHNTSKPSPHLMQTQSRAWKRPEETWARLSAFCKEITAKGQELSWLGKSEPGESKPLRWRLHTRHQQW